MATTYPLDYRKWFDRFQPQTLQIATFLLYINAFFALIDWLGTTGWIGIARAREGTLGTFIGLAIVVAYTAGAFLMANERRVGWKLSVAAAFSPFLLRFWVLRDLNNVSLIDKLTGQRLLGFIFDVALCALLLHPLSRSHERVYYR